MRFCRRSPISHPSSGRASDKNESSTHLLLTSTQMILMHEIMIVKEDVIDYFFRGVLPRACALISSKK